MRVGRPRRPRTAGPRCPPIIRYLQTGSLHAIPTVDLIKRKSKIPKSTPMRSLKSSMPACHLSFLPPSSQSSGSSEFGARMRAMAVSTASFRSAEPAMVFLDPAIKLFAVGIPVPHRPCSLAITSQAARHSLASSLSRYFPRPGRHRSRPEGRQSRVVQKRSDPVACRVISKNIFRPGSHSNCGLRFFAPLNAYRRERLTASGGSTKIDFQRGKAHEAKAVAMPHP